MRMSWRPIVRTTFSRSVQTDPEDKISSTSRLNLIGFLRGGVLISFVRHRQISKARTVDPGLRGNRLPVEIRSGVQAALVEDLGRKGADFWMQAPRLFQEQSSVRRDRGMGTKDVVESRDFRPFRMAALNGLLELPRISKENDVPCGLRYREHIRQAHLSGLVHEQNIDRLVKFWARPKPRGTAGDMTTGFESFQWSRRCRSRTEGLGGRLQLPTPSAHNVLRTLSRSRFSLRHPASCG